MKKELKVRIFALILMKLVFCFALFTAWFYGNQHDWVGFGISLVLAVTAIIYIASVCFFIKIDKGFDRLEELLRKQNHDEKLPKSNENNKDKFPDA